MVTPLRVIINHREQLLSAGRITSAGLLLGPGASKVLTYRSSVEFFTSLGVPAADVLVIVVGAVELGAAGLFLLNRLPRIAVILVVPIMIAALVTAGPSWQNVGLLILVSGIFGVETMIDPETADESTTSSGDVEDSPLGISDGCVRSDR